MTSLKHKFWFGVAAPGVLSLLLVSLSVGEMLAWRVTEREASAIVGGTAIACVKVVAPSQTEGCDPANCPTTSYYAVAQGGGNSSISTNQLCPNCTDFGRYSSAGCNNATY